MKSALVSVLFVFVCTGAVVSVPLKNGDTACIARYLIDNNVISAASVEKHVRADESAANCVDKIGIANREFFRQLTKKSTGDKRVDACIATTLKRNNVTNLIFKEILMFHISDDKELRVLKDLKTIKRRFFDTAELICRHQDIFAPQINEKFDNLAQNNVDINDIYEFNEIKHCVRKFIVHNEVVKVDENKVDVEAKNIDQEDLEELDCKEVVDDLYNTMTKDIEEILLPSAASRFVQTSCVVARAEKFNFLEKMFSYVFLIHSNLSKQSKSLVRRKADETEPSVERYMLECINLY